ncbi:hypothetical protein ERC79_18290 [Rhodococcus sp. ABRD24]|uniref:hypothetical protein n=1 Tax=Rhodococcus sp. ABRD24 TaxID=2507582 RepID=UPI0010406E11|nr:hypothetical protein [Rhodococcus sp. ABRD24]QBJ97672.1 hypothetical protein ERC79_18290 [Rhodococcus sp. ABRD24]
MSTSNLTLDEATQSAELVYRRDNLQPGGSVSGDELRAMVEEAYRAGQGRRACAGIATLGVSEARALSVSEGDPMASAAQERVFESAITHLCPQLAEAPAQQLPVCEDSQPDPPARPGEHSGCYQQLPGG